MSEKSSYLYFRTHPSYFYYCKFGSTINIPERTRISNYFLKERI